MSRPPLRGRLKANAVVLARLLNSPSTRKDKFGPSCHAHEFNSPPTAFSSPQYPSSDSPAPAAEIPGPIGRDCCDFQSNSDPPGRERQWRMLRNGQCDGRHAAFGMDLPVAVSGHGFELVQRCFRGLDADLLQTTGRLAQQVHPVALPAQAKQFELRHAPNQHLLRGIEFGRFHGLRSRRYDRAQHYRPTVIPIRARGSLRHVHRDRHRHRATELPMA